MITKETLFNCIMVLTMSGVLFFIIVKSLVAYTEPMRKEKERRLQMFTLHDYKDEKE